MTITFARHTLGGILWPMIFLQHSAASGNVRQTSLEIPSTLPEPWKSQGCYFDVGRTLTDGQYIDNVQKSELCGHRILIGMLYVIDFSQTCCLISMLSRLRQHSRERCRPRSCFRLRNALHWKLVRTMWWPE
ncbi:hypothetical protein CJF30_00004561 [Rutstroemia sp. NJR-2017a BBW]|nr:hypothetical protein CJF30_00004561 [Rutstroemia sp. NJR-2017a BBW]